MVCGRRSLLLRSFLCCVLLLSVAVGTLPADQGETVEISRKKLERFEQIFNDTLGSSTILEMSLAERMMTIADLEQQLGDLRTQSRMLHGYVASFENRLDVMQLQLSRLREGHERALRSSIRFETEAIRENRRKEVWQTAALGFAGATVGAMLSDSPWGPVVGFAGVVGITVGVRSIGSGEG